jgi:hypothetical protein
MVQQHLQQPVHQPSLPARHLQVHKAEVLLQLLSLQLASVHGIRQPVSPAYKCWLLVEVVAVEMIMAVVAAVAE